MEYHNFIYNWSQYELQIKYYNFIYYCLQWKIDPEKLNNYKNFAILVFFLSFHYLRRFITNQSIVFLFSKMTLFFIDVVLLMALQMIIDPY